MLAIKVKASYIHEFNERVRVQPPVIIYLPDSKSERSQKSQTASGALYSCSNNLLILQQ